MSSINVSQMRGFFKPGQKGGYDINGDGKLDRPEIAKASLNLLGSENPQAQNAGRLMATFVQGGKDGKGLLPDYNHDNALSLNELNRFAGPSGNISSKNFQNTFGDRFQSGGSSLNINGLHTIAEGNLGKFNRQDPNFPKSVGSLGADPQHPSAGNQIPPQYLKMLAPIIQFLKANGLLGAQ
jgi:hypothetical protein